MISVTMVKDRDKLCPFCAVATAPKWTWSHLDDRSKKMSTFCARWGQCNNCGEFLVQIGMFDREYFNARYPGMLGDPFDEIEAWGNGVRRVWYAQPRSYSRPVDPHVPPNIAEDYREAAAVLELSPKASAALSRRCLQHVIREHLEIKKRDLYNEIQVVLDSNKFSSALADALHHVREIGKFAAHPIKSELTGEIFDVEPGEAEWLLETLDALFDEVFVKPAVFKERKAAIQRKIDESKKKPE